MWVSGRVVFGGLVLQQEHSLVIVVTVTKKLSGCSSCSRNAHCKLIYPSFQMVLADSNYPIIALLVWVSSCTRLHLLTELPAGISISPPRVSAQPWPATDSLFHPGQVLDCICFYFVEGQYQHVWLDHFDLYRGWCKSMNLWSASQHFTRWAYKSFH